MYDLSFLGKIFFFSFAINSHTHSFRRKKRTMLRNRLETAFAKIKITKYKTWNDIETYAKSNQCMVYVYEDTTFHLLGDSMYYTPHEIGDKSNKNKCYIYFDNHHFYFLESPLNEFDFLIDEFIKKASPKNKSQNPLRYLLQLFSISDGFNKRVLSTFHSFLQEDEFVRTVLTIPHILNSFKDLKTSSPNNKPLLVYPLQGLDVLVNAATFQQQQQKPQKKRRKLPMSSLFFQQEEPKKQETTTTETKNRRNRIYQLTEEQKRQIMTTEHRNEITKTIIYKQGDIIFYTPTTTTTTLRKAVIVRTILTNGNHTDTAPSDELIWGYTILRYNHHQQIEDSPTTIPKQNIKRIFSIGTIVKIKQSINQNQTIIGFTNNGVQFNPLDIDEISFNQFGYIVMGKKKKRIFVNEQDIERVVRLQTFKISPFHDSQYQKFQNFLQRA